MPKKPNEPLRGSLADQLRQAGLLSEKKAQQIERDKKKDERRVRKQQKVERSSPTDAERARIEAERAQAERAAADRARAVATTDAAGRERWRKLVSEHAERGTGNRRFYFVDRDGSIPFVEPPDMKALQSGEAAIVETHDGAPGGGPGVAVVAGRKVVEELWRLDPDSVRYWNGSTPPRRLPPGLQPPAPAGPPGGEETAGS